MDIRIVKGSALIMAVMVSVILFILIGGSIAIIGTSNSQVANKIEESENYWALESAVNFAVKKLRNLEKDNTKDVFETRPLNDPTAFKDHYNQSYNAVGCSGQNQVDYLEAFKVANSPSTWKIIAKIKKKNGEYSTMTLDNIQVDSPFRYCRSVYGTRPLYDASFKFFGPTYFDEGLMTTAGLVYNYGNPEASTTNNARFYGDVYSAGDFYSEALAINIQFDANNNIIPYANGSDYKIEDLLFDGYDYEYDGVNLHKRKNWFRAGKPLEDQDGNKLDFSDYYYGLYDTENNWTGGTHDEHDLWSLTQESPQQTIDRLKKTFRTAYHGGVQNISKPNILEKSFSDIFKDNKIIPFKTDAAVNGGMKNIVLDFNGQQAKAYYRKDIMEVDPDNWIPINNLDGNNNYNISNFEGVAFADGYENVAVMGNFSQDFTVITHSADIEILDDIAPTSVYTELAGIVATSQVDGIDNAGDLPSGDFFSEENATNSAQWMQDLMAKSKNKIALVAGAGDEEGVHADIFISLRNLSESGKPGEAGAPVVNDYDATNLKAMIIGAALFAPNGGFGFQYGQAKNALPLFVLGSLSTGGTLDKGSGWGISGYNDFKEVMDDGDFSKAAIRVNNIADPRNSNGLNPPMISKALVKDKYTGLLEINFNSNYRWSYVK